MYSAQVFTNNVVCTYIKVLGNSCLGSVLSTLDLFSYLSFYLKVQIVSFNVKVFTSILGNECRNCNLIIHSSPILGDKLSFSYIFSIRVHILYIR